MWKISLAIMVLGGLGVTGGIWVWRHIRRRQAALALANQRSEFGRRREWLEAKFLETANLRGTPRGLEWVDCDFDSPVSFAKDRQTQELTALVAVTVQFRAIEGGGMEHVEAVANRKAATAVFRYRHQAWMTEGRAIFNLNPTEALAYYQQELEPVE